MLKAARGWGTTLSQLLTGTEGWEVYDRLLVLALAHRDMDLCPSGAGPEHYMDECDGDTTEIEPEVIERTCIYLHASEERQEELQKETPEKGLLVGWRDGADQEDVD
ncbi:hypothetical protein ACTXKN_12365 [Brachybacterium alimentarium]|uniref:hypothetical protein n=1 Tax=Brachybacterium alimentarium TaxID=47845 RepID=UPI003FD4690B